MQLKTIFYLALSIFGLGLLYKASIWFSSSLAEAPSEMKPPARVYAAMRGIVLTLFSPKVFKVIKVILFEVLFQSRLWKVDRLRWLAHVLIFWGFLLLLLVHALGDFILQPLSDSYYPTLNPYFFLRDFSGLMVFAGLAIAMYRRFIGKAPRSQTHAVDLYAILIIAVIMISGVFLEGLKISSQTEFDRMVEQYTGGLDPEEAKALESVWVQSFGLASAHVQKPFAAEVIEKGLEVHEENCAGCHASAKWAFTGYAVAEISRPVAPALDAAGGVDILWYLHILAVFAGLAYLPFSKMFHIIATPLALIVNAVMDDGAAGANVATIQAMEIDACTRCGACSLTCSVIPAFRVTGNKYVLPSEKMIYLQRERAKALSPEKRKLIQEGFCLCTDCGRCTEVCPSGIRLKDMWFRGQEALLQNGAPELHAFSALSFARGVRSDKVPADRYPKPMAIARKLIADACDTDELKRTPIRLERLDKEFKSSLVQSLQGESVSLCFSCTSCSMACPVVNSYDDPVDALDLLPHQVIRAAVLGMVELAFNSDMLWYCLGCYQCQEICPQNVQITDIFCELKNMAIGYVEHKTNIAAGNAQ